MFYLYTPLPRPALPPPAPPKMSENLLTFSGGTEMEHCFKMVNKHLKNTSFESTFPQKSLLLQTLGFKTLFSVSVLMMELISNSDSNNQVKVHRYISLPLE